MFTFPNPLPVVFGLAFDIVKSEDTESGFAPAERDRAANMELFGDMRLVGFADLMHTEFASELIVVGGIEARYPGENIARGWAIMQMLVKDFGIRSDRVKFLVSGSNTAGNVDLIAQHAGDQPATVVSNHYHLPRAARDFALKPMLAHLQAAESFTLLRDPDAKQMLINGFGGGPYAERVAEEIQGMADKLRGKYTPRAKT